MLGSGVVIDRVTVRVRIGVSGRVRVGGLRFRF